MSKWTAMPMEYDFGVKGDDSDWIVATDGGCIASSVDKEDALEIVRLHNATLDQPQPDVGESIKCPDCIGFGEHCLAGCSAHPSNWYKCETCNGTGKIINPLLRQPEPADAVSDEEACSVLTDYFNRSPSDELWPPEAYRAANIEAMRLALKPFAARHARGVPTVTYEVWQDGELQASSDTLDDANHYMFMYGQDGPAELRKVTSYSEVIDSTAQPTKDADHEGDPKC